MNFIKDFKDYLPNYISNGNPSDDTLRTYEDEISRFISWCNENQIAPLKMSEIQANSYVRSLYTQKYAKASVAIKLAAIKAFYRVANKLKVTSENPFAEIKAQKPSPMDAQFNFLTNDEVKAVFESIKASNFDSRTRKRNLAIFMLMAVEGLRVIEIHRLSDQDINFWKDLIYIHGKGHNDFIYPCADTMEILEEHLHERLPAIDDKLGTPTFISNNQTRLSRDGLRWIINNILINAGMKKKGSSCHMLRHSCGTNLYESTKDLRLVQETLRQRNPTITARYAHVSKQMAERKTSYISPVTR